MTVSLLVPCRYLCGMLALPVKSSHDKWGLKEKAIVISPCCFEIKVPDYTTGPFRAETPVVPRLRACSLLGRC